MLTLVQLLQVSAPVTLSFMILTMELLHLTANLAMETAKLVSAQPILIEQAVSMHMQKQQTPVLALAYWTTTTQMFSLLIVNNET